MQTEVLGCIDSHPSPPPLTFSNFPNQKKKREKCSCTILCCASANSITAVWHSNYFGNLLSKRPIMAELRPHGLFRLKYGLTSGAGEPKWMAESRSLRHRRTCDRYFSNVDLSESSRSNCFVHPPWLTAQPDDTKLQRFERRRAVHYFFSIPCSLPLNSLWFLSKLCLSRVTRPPLQCASWGVENGRRHFSVWQSQWCHTAG